MAQLADQPVGELISHLTDPLDALLACAPVIPVSSPVNGDGCVFFIFPLRKSFHHLSPWFTLGLNHALDQSIW